MGRSEAAPARRGDVPALKLTLTALAAGLVTVVAAMIAASSLPGLVGFTSVVVLSGSMEPVLGAGDIAVTRSVDPATVKVGDVVTYRSGARFVTHRIAGIVDGPDGRHFQVKGDNNPTPDSGLVPEDQVVAKLAYRLPKLGYVVSFVNSPNGFTVFIIAPAVVLALMWYRDRRRKKAPSGPAPTATDRDGRQTG